MDNIILGGDLNCPLDPLLDKKAEQVQKGSQLSLVSTVPKIINKYEEGGLRMVDLECMVKSLRLAWLKRSFSGTSGTWKSYRQHIVSSVGGLFFFNCNYNRAVYTRENKPRLTLAAAYIRRERNHLYEYGLY